LLSLGLLKAAEISLSGGTHMLVRSAADASIKLPAIRAAEWPLQQALRCAETIWTELG
jgi:hypothetical protein